MATVVEEILSDWRQYIDLKAGDPPVRFVIETPSPPADLEETVRAFFEGFTFTLNPLFEPEEGRAKPFLRLELLGVPRPDREDLFELANALQAATGAVTVEPDIGSTFFQEDRLIAQTMPEGLDWTFWCWAERLPANPDWAVERVCAPDAWQYSNSLQRTSEGGGIKIFQPDTGVVPTHTALPRNIERDSRSANFIEGGRPIDPLRSGMNKGHGTGTSSVIVGTGTMRGVAPKADLIPIRCIETVAVFDQSPVAQAVDHARRNGADVITMSLGGVPSRALRSAVEAAVNQNIIVVAAAGNCVSQVVWPARYESVIAVGGTNDLDDPWQGSCRGAAVAVSAPAEFVRRALGSDSSVPPQVVSGGQGTSFATALTAGVAALWLAHHGRNALIEKLPSGVRLQHLFRHLVRASADKAPKLDPDEYGAGIVNAKSLLTHAIDVNIRLEGADAFGDSGVLELLEETFGAGALEATKVALADPQYHLELAHAALQYQRFMASPKARTESAPPIVLSPTLRQIVDVRALSEEIRP